MAGSGSGSVFIKGNETFKHVWSSLINHENYKTLEEKYDDFLHKWMLTLEINLWKYSKS